jgi:Rhodopirellula transposase DDE domain
MNTRKWLNCRLRDIQAKLVEVGHQVSLPVISRLLKAHDYRLRVNRKEAEGADQPDRDRQFAYIHDQRAWHEQAGQPRISVDTKKKELVGNFKNAGQIWCQQAEIVKDHDFPQEAEGRAVPYGIYDLQHNQASVYVGHSADTPTFAVDNLAAWCRTELPQRFPHATHLFIEADGGGSNASRSCVFKQQVQEKIADALGLSVTVCHYPPGTSKWNPIEHRVFSEISKTWQGCPLRSFKAVLDYLRDTKTQTGLTVQAQLVTQVYRTGVKVSKAIMTTLNIQKHEVCPQWNYTIRPRSLSLPT